MTKLFEYFSTLHGPLRIIAVILVAVGGHLLIRIIRKISEWIIEPSKTPGAITKELFEKRHPKFATVASLVASAITFSIYFLAIGLILNEFKVSLTAYLATASVVGLAIGFGAQGLVQDIVIGLTLVFSHTFDIGDMIEVSGQIGRVESVGLRFIKIKNFLGQTIFIPNRTVGLIGRYRRGCIRAYLDIQIPKGIDEDKVKNQIDSIIKGIYSQYEASFTSEPEIFGFFDSAGEGWRYLRLRLRIWPGQGPFIENVSRSRMLAVMKSLDATYQDWMVTTIYRVN